ncbi:MAG TPA: alpha-1,4-glucan--maltose-1-phosphate maltosyltransferase [Acidimicrobiales bacterium]|nr:alpha-1,4-glucan--maltose-1-phosphate maltosyltransferase [Acidimicrobiales bacterium]
MIEAIRPQVDGGRRPAKAALDDLVRVEADVFADGHDALWCDIRYRHVAATKWTTVPMSHMGNDHWRGIIAARELGRYRFMIRARIDDFATWVRDLSARLEAGQDVKVELLVGAALIQEAAMRAKNVDRLQLTALATQLRSDPRGLEGDLSIELAEWYGGHTLQDAVFSDRLGLLMSALGDPDDFAVSETYNFVVDTAKARCSAWYEMFPRSAASDPSRHGTFADVRASLDYVAQMGFDVLYLPPIHPIGRTGRKGREGAVVAHEGDPGSPWAIGATEGGHRAIHPELGSMEDFVSLVRDAADRGIDVALDLAFQASPDHPWVTEHPEWFRHRPDGTIRHAENPPKRYEDIYPIDFNTTEWQSLWIELQGVVQYWISAGVRVFRVDNPHTKPFAFWEWLLAWARTEYPDVIFLAEAFTKPRVMEQLAKIGFTQSYTYFAWRSSKWELETYLTELTATDVADYFRPNFWPATPDILTEELQTGGRAAFLSRLVLAATLSANYGIYGPAFELQEHVPKEPGSEEYRRSEKYEIRSWDRDDPESLSAFIAQINQIRHDHPALHFNDALTFHPVDNDRLIAYSKTRRSSPHDDIIVTIVNLDHGYPQSGWVDLNLDVLRVDPARPYVMQDLLTDARYAWQGHRNFVKLDPDVVPCHIFSLRQAPPESPVPV